MMTTAVNKPQHLYVHVPFCAHICGYCDFAHIVYRSETVEQWLEAIEKEIRAKQIRTDLTTIYVGGGTPTSLSVSELDRFLSLLDPYMESVQEYTIEINPETLDEEKCQILSKHGINRASIGFETSDEKLLKLMGRSQSLSDMHACISLLRKYGIHNISLDIMYSLPFQTMESLQKSVKDAVSLDPYHLSLYSLTIEENTVFDKKGYHSLDEDTEADMYEWICSFLPERGYRQYEVSNFAKNGYESRHNCAYWNYRDFYGIGCGASGKENHARYDHTKNVRDYISNPLKTEITNLSKKDEMFEMWMMSIRLKQGMDLNLFEKTFHISFLDVWRDTTEKLIRDGYLVIRNAHLCCTEKGYEIMNSLLVEYI